MPFLHSCPMAPGYFSTEQVARKLGVTRAAVHLWIQKGQVAPPLHKIGRALVWTDADIARVRAAQKKIKPGRPRKGRGRKPAKKRSSK